MSLIAKLTMITMAVFFFATAVLFSLPVHAGTDWACKNGGTPLEEYIANIDKIPTRAWTIIKGERDFKMVFLLAENGYAEVRIIVGKCMFASSPISSQSVIETFDLDLKKTFPLLKKGSY